MAWHLQCSVCGEECGHTWAKVTVIFAYSALPEFLSPRKTLNVCHECTEKARNVLEAKNRCCKQCHEMIGHDYQHCGCLAPLVPHFIGELLATTPKAKARRKRDLNAKLQADYERVCARLVEATDERDRMASDEWYTPDEVLSFFEGWDDPCLPGRDDGLLRTWGKKTFVNPPYSRPMPWIEKAIIEARQGKRIVMLLKHDSSTEWWRKLHEAGAHFFAYIGRMRFSGGGRAPFSSVLVMLTAPAERKQT